MDLIVAIAIGTILLIILVIIILFISFKNSGSRDLNNEKLERLEKISSENAREIRDEASKNSSLLREELSKSIKEMSDFLLSRINDSTSFQKQQIESFREENSKAMDKIRETVEKRLSDIQKENNEKLNKMREMVEEKIQASLEKRLGESFNTVNKQLEAVHKGLGEMKNLADGVGDLKRILGNVKSRGVFGEIQLSAILEDIMSPDQYDKNVHTKKNSRDSVEYAIKLPNKNNSGDILWLPIDAKFPIADYERMVSARENGNINELEINKKQLETRIKNEAKKILNKYIDPPFTTDFAIMFLPTEGLFLEVLNIPGLAEEVRDEYKIIISGPTTLSALLNSLQLGFRTLAIEKRSSEVWKILGSVKKEFGKFGDILDKVRKKLSEASNTMNDASVRTRAIEKHLKSVEELPYQNEEKSP